MSDHLDQIADDLRALNEAAASVSEALQTVEAARDGFQANSAAQLVSAEYLKTAGTSLESASANLSGATEALVRFDPERIELELTALGERVVAEATRTREEAERHASGARDDSESLRERVGSEASKTREETERQASDARDSREAVRLEAAATRRQLLILGLVLVVLQIAVLVAALWR